MVLRAFSMLYHDNVTLLKIAHPVLNAREVQGRIAYIWNAV